MRGDGGRSLQLIFVAAIGGLLVAGCGKQGGTSRGGDGGWPLAAMDADPPSDRLDAAAPPAGDAPAAAGDLGGREAVSADAPSADAAAAEAGGRDVSLEAVGSEVAAPMPDGGGTDLPSVPGEATPAACDQDGWCWVHPLPQGNDLLTVWGAAPNDVWAAGKHGAIVHWDGQRWSSYRSPTRGWYTSIWGTSPSDVWICAGAIMRWDGRNLAVVAVPPTRAGCSSVHGTGANDVWFTDGYLKHWNGERWDQPQRTTTNTNILPRAHWVTSPTSVWAVGLGAIGHVSGRGGDGNFERVHSLGLLELFDVWAPSDDEVWVVGEQGTIVRRVGGTFLPVSRPAGVGNQLRMHSVWGTGAGGAVWIAGDQGTILRWNGQVLEKVESGVGVDLHALWGFGPNDVWAVGQYGVFLHWDGTRWSKSPRLTEIGLNAIHGNAADDIWMVGGGGTVLRWNGTRLTALDSLDERPLTDVWGSSANDVWITGWDGKLFHWKDGAFTTTTFPEMRNLHSVRGTAADDVWVVSNTVRRFDGQTWTPVDLGAGNGAIDVYPLSRDDVWMTGGGNAHHWTRSTARWTSYPIIINENRIWAAGPNDVWIAGGYGVKRFDGTTWTMTVRPQPANNMGIWGSSADDFWVVGGQGQILHQAGGVWSSRPTEQRATQHSLEDVWGSSANDVWIVGEGGAVLRRRR